MVCIMQKTNKQKSKAKPKKKQKKNKNKAKTTRTTKAVKQINVCDKTWNF